MTMDKMVASRLKNTLPRQTRVRNRSIPRYHLQNEPIPNSSTALLRGMNFATTRKMSCHLAFIMVIQR